MDYFKEDLYFSHYFWGSDETLKYGLVIDTRNLDILDGYEVLLFANAFLDMYVDSHTKNDLHTLEYILLHHLPKYITKANDIASWLAKQNNHFEFVRAGLYNRNK